MRTPPTRESNTSPREINTSPRESNTRLQGVRPIQRRIRPILSLTLSITALLAPSIALSETAAPAAPPTEEMIVTASHTPRSRTTLSQSVSVIEAEQLNSSISTSLDDVLRFIPGLQVTREGARGGRSQISLRGLDPNHVVILIDGVRLNDPTNSRGGSFDPTTRNVLDLGAMVAAKQRSHLPVIADPSHGTGRRDMIAPLSLAAVAAGADGLIIEAHPDPDQAWSDGAQSLYLEQLRELGGRLAGVRAAASSD